MFWWAVVTCGFNKAVGLEALFSRPDDVPEQNSTASCPGTVDASLEGPRTNAVEFSFRNAPRAHLHLMAMTSCALAADCSSLKPPRYTCFFTSQICRTVWGIRVCVGFRCRLQLVGQWAQGLGLARLNLAKRGCSVCLAPTTPGAGGGGRKQASGQKGRGSHWPRQRVSGAAQTRTGVPPTHVGLPAFGAPAHGGGQG